MFMGHLGLALGAKGMRQEVSLLLLCVAATAPDLVDFTLMSRYPGGAGLWSHSLVAMFGYAILFFSFYKLSTHRTTSAILLGIVASSHVLLDLITSRMVLWPGGSPIGMHLYLHRDADLCLESAVVLAGWLLYTRSIPQQRRYSLPSVVILLVLLAMQGLMATMKIT